MRVEGQRKIKGSWPLLPLPIDLPVPVNKADGFSLSPPIILKSTHFLSTKSPKSKAKLQSGVSAYQRARYCFSRIKTWVERVKVTFARTKVRSHRGVLHAKQVVASESNTPNAWAVVRVIALWMDS